MSCPAQSKASIRKIEKGVNGETITWTLKTVLAGRNLLGFVNPPVYYLATVNGGKNYRGVNGRFADFHDITSGTNSSQFREDPRYYSAVKGYDDATGWGSFVGANLFGDLISIANTGAITQLLGNSRFENTDGGSAARYAAAIAP